MSQPPQPYSRVFDFTAFSVATPSAQQPGNKIDQELNAVLASLNATIARLSEAQRDDGKIRASALDATEFQGIVDAATADAEAAAASAAGSATTATTKASEASASALSASNSATSASASAGSVAAQVATATTAATNANTSAADAAFSAADALMSKNSAFSSASSATSSAGAAAGSAIDAATLATNAATSAINAANSASAAASSASTATSQASAAAGSATAASGSASSAAAWAVDAANSAASINPSAYAPAVHTHAVGDITGLAGALVGYAPLNSPAFTGNMSVTTSSTLPALKVTQTGTGAVLVLEDQAGDTSTTVIDQNGKLSTIVPTSTSAGFNLPHGSAAPSSPVNGDLWSTSGGLFARISNATQSIATQSWVFSNGYMTLSSALNAFSPKVAPVYQDFSQVAGVYDYHNGALINLLYNGGTDGRVAFYDGLPAGSKIQFYQDEQATQPITFNGAFNRENKLMTLGPKSQVTALKTFAGWLLYGDLQFPANGTLISEECAYWSGSDAVGTFWDGNYLHRITYADGSGGTYTSESLGGGTCYLPYGYCIESGVNINESTVSWSGCSNSGTATYSVSTGNIRADGSGGVYQETTGGYSAQYGDVIYDNGSGCVVKHDGMGGYFVEDNSGSGGNPSYGSYLGNFSGDLFVNVSGNDYLAGSYTEDRYADGNGGVAYTANRNDSWYGYGTNLGYDSNSGQSIYADGGGSYYLS